MLIEKTWWAMPTRMRVTCCLVASLAVRAAALSLSTPARLTLHRPTPLVSMGLFDWMPGMQKEAPPAGCARASHILFLADDYAENKADQLLKRISSGEISFGDAARGFSCCPSRDLNGDLGTFSSLGSLGMLPPIGELPYEGQDTESFDAVVMSPDTPLFTPVKVVSKWGVHLVLIEARGPPGDPSKSTSDGPSLPDTSSGAAW